MILTLDFMYHSSREFSPRTPKDHTAHFLSSAVSESLEEGVARTDL